MHSSHEISRQQSFRRWDVGRETSQRIHVKHENSWHTCLELTRFFRFTELFSSESYSLQVCEPQGLGAKFKDNTLKSLQSETHGIRNLPQAMERPMEKPRRTPLFCRQVTGVMNAIQGMFSALDRGNLSLFIELSNVNMFPTSNVLCFTVF